MFKFGNISRQKFRTSTAIDTNLQNTVLLLKGSSIRQFGVDRTSSLTEWRVPQNSNASPGISYSNPFSKNWCINFDETGSDYFYVNQASPALGAGNFTIEFFCRFTVSSLDGGTDPLLHRRRIMSQSNNLITGYSVQVCNTATSVNGQITPIGGLVFATSSDVVGTRIAVNDNQWHHIAFSKTGNDFSCFVDGILRQTSIFAFNLTDTSNLYFGCYGAVNGGFGNYAGQLSNIRTVVGTSVYSSNFTVPTSPLTNIPNTVLLFANNGIFNPENSRNPTHPSSTVGMQMGFTGNCFIRNFGPFVEDTLNDNLAITMTSTHSQSGWLYNQQRDGNVDYRFSQIGAGDWMAEIWVYNKFDASGFTTNWRTTAWRIGDLYLLTGNGGYWGGAWAVSNGGTSSRWLQCSQPVTYGGWEHIIVVKQGTNWGMFINGVNRATVTGQAYSVPVGDYIYLGSGISGNGGGIQICDFKFTAGPTTIAYNTATITLPTTPATLTSYGTTATNVLALAFDRTATKKNVAPLNVGYNPGVSLNPWSSTYMPVQGSYSPFITSGWSNFFDSGSDGLMITPLGPNATVVPVTFTPGSNLIAQTNQQSFNWAGNAMEIGKYDYTVEGWFNFANTATDNYLFSLGYYSGTAGFSTLHVRTTSTLVAGIGTTFLALYAAATTGTWAISTQTTATIVPGYWNHIAVTKTNVTPNTATIEMYLNGVRVSPGGTGYNITNTSTIASYAYNSFGLASVSGNPTWQYYGGMSNVRILKGISAYTGNFAVSTKPLRAVQDAAANIQPLFFPTDNTGNSVFLYGGNTGSYIFTVTNNLTIATTATSDFTIEAWVNPESFGNLSNTISTTATILQLQMGSSTSSGIVIGTQTLWNNTATFNATDGNLWLSINTGSISTSTGRPTSWPANNLGYSSTISNITRFKWNHVAVTRFQGAWQGYVNGQQVFNITTGSDFALNQPIIRVGIGGTGGPENSWWGGISNVRVTRNQAIYTGTFTASAVTFTTSTVGMIGANIAPTITGEVVLLAAQSIGFATTSSWAFSTTATYATFQTLYINTGSTSTNVFVVNTFTTSTVTLGLNTAILTTSTTTFTQFAGPVGIHPSLLMANSAQFVDQSLNTATITRLQDAKVYPYSPFKTLSSHNPDVNGGSVYFNGANYLKSSMSQMFPFHTKDFTIECWFMFETQQATVRVIWDMGNNGSLCPQLWVLTNGSLNYGYGAQTSLISSINNNANNVIKSGEWYHVAVTRFNNVTSLWCNGKLWGRAVDNNNYVAPINCEAPWLGCHGAAGLIWRGWMSSFRVTYDWALYTQEFAQPTRAPQLTTGTHVLVNFNNYSTYDATNKNIVNLYTDVRTRFDQSPYANNWSYYFDGYSPNDSVTIGQHVNGNNFEFGTGDFTVEMWAWARDIYQTRTLFDTCGLGETAANITNPARQEATFNGQGRPGRFAIQVASTGSIQVITTGSVAGFVLSSSNWFNAPANLGVMSTLTTVWNHIAVTRESNQLRIWFNGVQVNNTFTDFTYYTNTGTGTTTSTNRPILGISGFDNASNPWAGYISNVRVVKGLAVYTTSTTAGNTFTLPTGPWTTATTSATNIRAVAGVPQNGQSTYFSSGTSYLSSPVNAAFDLVNSAFTVEGWVQFNTTSTQGTMWSLGRDANNRMTVSLTATNSFLKLDLAQNGTTSTVAITTGTTRRHDWHHIAVSRDSGNLRFFVNGTQYGTTSTTSTFWTDGANQLSIGYQVFGGRTDEYMFGYVSNFRVIKGQGIYTGSFTPSRDPLTSTTLGSTGSGVAASLTGTVVLLTCQSNSIGDLSGNGRTVSAVGTASMVRDQSPFGFAPALITAQSFRNIDQSTSSWLVGTTGNANINLFQPFSNYNTALQLPTRSFYFDGSADWMRIQDQHQLRFGLSPFTIEFWMFMDAGDKNSKRGLVAKGDAGLTVGWEIYLDTFNRVCFGYSSTFFTGSSEIRLGEWNHIVVQRDGVSTQQTKIYLNGQLDATGTVPDNFDQGAGSGVNADSFPMYVGVTRDTSNNFKGYIDDLRITNYVGRYPLATYTLPSATYNER